jgi:hypothetical protein
MNHVICLCCGEPIAVKANAPSQNPNLCASCANFSDETDESNPRGRNRALSSKEDPNCQNEKTLVPEEREVI